MRDTRFLRTQCNFTPCSHSYLSKAFVGLRRRIGESVRQLSVNLAVDQFFAQSQNLKDGDVCTSPLLAGNINNAEHFVYTNDVPSFPSSVPASVIHKTLMPRLVQTPSEVASFVSAYGSTLNIPTDDRDDNQSSNDKELDPTVSVPSSSDSNV